MTCVIGYQTGDGIWIGADSAGSTEYGAQSIRADTKVFYHGPMTFGFCGSYRMGQLLRFNLELSEHPEGMDDFEYMVTKFIEDVRHVLNVGGFTYIKNNVEEGGYFMVAYRNGLYEIDADFQVGINARNYVCIGSGEEYAYGAMAILDQIETDPVKAIKRALKVSADNNAFVAPPFVVRKHKQ